MNWTISDTNQQVWLELDDRHGRGSEMIWVIDYYNNSSSSRVKARGLKLDWKIPN